MSLHLKLDYFNNKLLLKFTELVLLIWGMVTACNSSWVSLFMDGVLLDFG